MNNKFWNKVVRKKDQPWKVDEYSGINRERLHNHKVVSGALIVGGKAVGGDIYYNRENGKVLVNLDEEGNSLI